jgi:hypothetical protein
MGVLCDMMMLWWRCVALLIWRKAVSRNEPALLWAGISSRPETSRSCREAWSDYDCAHVEEEYAARRERQADRQAWG